MSVAGELSEEADLYSLAQNATYFEIEPEDGRILGEEMVDDMPVFRKSWEKITIKNKPFLYKSSAVSKNKVYDLIIDNPTTTTYFLKLVYGTKTYYGYFGEVDCDINEDRSIITINPAVVDQYTDFIENYEEEINIFGTGGIEGENLVQNGRFEVWTDGLPDHWLSLLNVIWHKTLLDSDCAVLNKELYWGSDFLNQGIGGIISGNKIKITFNYKYIGENEDTDNLRFQVSLAGGSETYRLNPDGSWTTGDRVDIFYKTNAYAVTTESVESFDLYSLISEPAPVNGSISIGFFGGSVSGNELYITNVEVYSSGIDYVDVSLNLLSDNITSQTQENIGMVKTTFHSYPLFYAKVKAKDKHDIEDYFNANGSPNTVLLDDSYHGVHNQDGLTYPDWNTIFDDDVNSDFYKGEMCELHMVMGHAFVQFFTTYRNFYGYATYAREEYYKEDEYNESESLIPPEEGVGWEQTDQKVNNQRLWVRKPFNGAYSSVDWDRSEVFHDGNVNLGTWNIAYAEYCKSKLNYPINSSSVAAGTGFDFRDLVRKIYNSTHESRLGKEVYSAFFWNDSPYIDFLEIEDGQNYYNMKQNFLNYISVVHTSTIKQITNQDLDDAELKMSFKQLWDDLQVKFPALVWFVDTNMNLHIEHLRFIHRVRSFIDISGTSISYIGEYKSYKFDTSKLYGYIKREDINSYYKDFVTSEQTFRKITTNKRRKDQKKDEKTSYVSTDIRGAIENAADLGNGILLISYFVNDSGENEILYGNGQITGKQMPNALLSTSFLLKEFGNYMGTWHEGIVDGQTVYYHFSEYCKTGDDIVLKGIVDENYAYTDIGMALIKTKKFDYENETTTCTPVYRHVDFYVTAEDGVQIEMDYEYTDILAN